MLSADGEIVYVGKSKKVRTRLLSYFRCSFPEDKGARILRDAVRIEWEYAPSEFAALLLELRQIKRLRPRFNVAMKRDDRNFVFIKVVKSPAPKLMVVRGASDDSAPHYGPFQGAQAVDDAVRELNDVLVAARLLARHAHALRRSARALSARPRTPGLHPLRGEEVPRPVRRRMHGERVSRSASRSRAPFSTARTTGRSRRCATRWKRRATRWSSSARHRCATSCSGSRRSSSSSCAFASRSRRCRSSTPCRATAERIASISFVAGACARRTFRPQADRDHRRLAHLTDAVYGTAERDTAQIPTHEIDELLLLSSWFRRFPAELERTVRAADVGLTPVTGAAVRAPKVRAALADRRAVAVARELGAQSLTSTNGDHKDEEQNGHADSETKPTAVFFP